MNLDWQCIYLNDTRADALFSAPRYQIIKSRGYLTARPTFPMLLQIRVVTPGTAVDWQVINEGLAYSMEGLMEDPDRLQNALFY